MAQVKDLLFEKRKSEVAYNNNRRSQKPIPKEEKKASDISDEKYIANSVEERTHDRIKRLTELKRGTSTDGRRPT